MNSTMIISGDCGRILRQNGHDSAKIDCNYGNKSAKTGFETLAL